jgi:CubicO group peptidase (beta-lactamase class C family)
MIRHSASAGSVAGLRSRILIGVVFTALLGGSVLAQAPPAAQVVDILVADVMKTFDVPGMSVAVVKDGKTVLAKGYGVKRLGATAAVDAETQFGIASNTKVLTALALGLLVEEGKIGWDAPVIRYLPWFRLSDPYVTKELTIRDLLVHRSGLSLGAGDLLWWPPSTYTRREISERLQFIPLATSFRNTYAYDNVLYLVAGEVIEAVSGKSWEDFVMSRLLQPMGMSSSDVRHSAANGAGNIATPHAPVDGKVRPVSPFASDNTNPAGGVMSGATDMSKWLAVFLARGELPNGTRLFSEATWRQLTTIVTPLPPTTPGGRLTALRSNFRGYALGLGVQDYRGKQLFTHTGGLPGYVSRVAWVPEIGLGVAVLTNQESGEAFNAVTWSVIDHYLGVKDTDWVAAYVEAKAVAADQLRKADAASTAARAEGSTPSLPLPSYAGTYTDAWYGDVVLAMEGNTLAIRFTKTPLLVGDLEHWQHDTFVARWRDRELRADAFITFALNPDGTIDQAKMRPVSRAVDFSFDFQDLLLVPKR